MGVMIYEVWTRGDDPLRLAVRGGKVADDVWTRHPFDPNNDASKAARLRALFRQPGDAACHLARSCPGQDPTEVFDIRPVPPEPEEVAS